MKKEIEKYPYNSRVEEETKKFLSDQICEKIISIAYKNGQIFCMVKDKLTNRKKEIAISAVILGGATLGRPEIANSVGLAFPPKVPPLEVIAPEQQQIRSAPVITKRVDKAVFSKTIVYKRLDKISFMPITETIPLIYLNAQNVYINEKVLKKLRAGDLATNSCLVAIGVVVYIMFQFAGVDAFQIIANWNAPQASPQFGTAPSSSSTAIASVPTQAQEFNDLLLKFNEPKISYNFVMSDQEANRRVNEMYPGFLEISSNTHISDVKAANKIYHASQLGVNPKDYGITNEEVQRINEIGIYKYAKEGHQLPPIELIKDYQMAIKNICTNGKQLEGTYSSRAEQKIHKAIFNYNMYNMITREVVGFYKETGELITSTKYKESTFQNFLITKNLGTLK